MIERVVLVSPRGFCAGVIRAIATVENALATLPSPVYVRHAIVHNGDVVARLTDAGALFVEDLAGVPRGSVAILGAHGVAMSVRADAARRGVRVIDATCPLVAKIHREVRRYDRLGYDVLLVGHRDHDEVVGTLGQSESIQLVQDIQDARRVQVRRPDRVACVTQTTLRERDVAPVVAELERRFPGLVRPRVADICYATRNRQAAVESLAARVDVVLIVGDFASSNSRRLCEAAAAVGADAHLIPRATAIDEAWLRTARTVGVSAGASTPEDRVEEVIDLLCRAGASLENMTFVEERVRFSVPAAVAG